MPFSRSGRSRDEESTAGAAMAAIETRLPPPSAAAPSEPLTGNYFVAAYPPFSCWHKAGADVARSALRTPSPTRSAGLGFYVHIPFCDERCDFCYYLSFDDRAAAIDPYIDSLIAEAALYADCPGVADRPCDFLYFGGGTPSLLSKPRLQRLFEGLGASIDWAGAREVTFECAPRSVTPAKLEQLRAAGVTRLSLGVQQLNDDVLRRNGRIHLVADVLRAYREIRAIGFDVVNFDLIVGLVGETEETFFGSLDSVIELEPDCVTIYLLEIPRNTPLYRRLEAGEHRGELADWEVKRRRLTEAFARLECAGYYQLTAYAAVRDPDRHRFLYMSEQYSGCDLIGLGASAFSYFDGVHFQSPGSLATYQETIASGRLPVARGYALSADERLVRELALQVKLGRVDLGRLGARHHVAVAERFAPELAELCARGLLKVAGDQLELTPAGRVRADRVLEAFYRPEHRGQSYW